MKDQYREETAALVAQFQGQVTKCPTKMAQGSDDKLFVHSKIAAKERRRAR